MKKEKWMATNGRILSKNIIEEDSGGSENSFTTYVVNIVWEYHVEGERFKGQSKGWGTGSYVREKDAKAKMEQYETGSEKEIYYNPEKHSESVFERESGALKSMFGNIATTMKGIGLAILSMFVVGTILAFIMTYFELHPLFLVVPVFLSPIAVYIWYFRSNYQ